MTAPGRPATCTSIRYEKAVDRAVEFELKVAEMTPQEWLKNLIETQVKFTRELSNSYTTTARSLLK